MSIRLPSPREKFDQTDEAQTRRLIETRFKGIPDQWTGSGKGVQQKAPSLTAPTVDSGTLRVTTSTALGTTGTVSLDPTLGEVFTMVPTGAVTLNAASAPIGARVALIITTSGVSSFNITPNTNFKSQGVLATGVVSAKVFTMLFEGDGTNMNEISRTVAM